MTTPKHRADRAHPTTSGQVCASRNRAIPPDCSTKQGYRHPKYTIPSRSRHRKDWKSLTNRSHRKPFVTIPCVIPRKSTTIFSKTRKYPIEADARRATQALLMQLKEESPRAEVKSPTLGAPLDRHVEHEFSDPYATRKLHLSDIRKQIRPLWSEHPVDEMKWMAMERWRRDLPLVPKSMTHLWKPDTRRPDVRGTLNVQSRWARTLSLWWASRNAVKQLKRPQIL